MRPLGRKRTACPDLFRKESRKTFSRATLDAHPADDSCNLPVRVLKLTQASDADKDDNADIATEEVQAAGLGEDARAEWLRSKEYLKQHIGNYVHILALDKITCLTDDIVKNAGG